jgi:Protein of unknown function (DUF2992)
MRATTFTVYFEDPFWVGVLEIIDELGVRAARHVFGEEPDGQELYAFGFSRDHDRLVRRAQAALPTPPSGGSKDRPRRPTRSEQPGLPREQAAIRPSTAAQAVLKAALEQSEPSAARRPAPSAEPRPARRRELARVKARARHRGH